MIASTVPRGGQSFLGNGKLVRVEFYISKSSTPNGTVAARLYASDGTFGTSGLPTGALLAVRTTLSTTRRSTSRPRRGGCHFDFAAPSRW